MKNLIKKLKEKMFDTELDDFIDLTQAMKYAKNFTPTKEIFKPYLIDDNANLEIESRNGQVVLYEKIVEDYKENKCELYFKKLTCYFDYEEYKSNEYCKIKNPTLAEDTQPTDYIRWEETYLATSEEEYNKMIEEN